MKPIQGKPIIIYPCPWTFKVIGWNESQMMAAIRDIIEPAEYRLSISRTSR